jgi:hypothetical protein
MKHTQIQRVYLLTLLALHPKQYFQKIFNIAKLNRLDVYGNPSEELQKVLTNFDSQTFNLFTGFNR